MAYKKKAEKVEPILPGTRELAGRRYKDKIPLEEVQLHQAVSLNGLTSVVNKGVCPALKYLVYIPEDLTVRFSTPFHGEIDIPVTNVSFMRRAKVCDQA